MENSFWAPKEQKAPSKTNVGPQYRRRYFPKALSRLAICGVALIGLVNGPASAHEAKVACPVEPALTGEQVDTFLSSPRQLLSEYPEGGLAMANRVRLLLASNSTTYRAVIDLAKDATTAQKAAIGAGVSRAVFACRDARPELAEQMMRYVVSAQDAMLLAGYSSANADTNASSISAQGLALGGGSIAQEPSQRSAENEYVSVGDRQSANSNDTFSAGGTPVIISRTTRR